MIRRWGLGCLFSLVPRNDLACEQKRDEGKRRSADAAAHQQGFAHGKESGPAPPGKPSPLKMSDGRRQFMGVA